MTQTVAIARTEQPVVFVRCRTGACWTALGWAASSGRAAFHVALPAASCLAS